MSDPFIVYFSTTSNNTHKFVDKLDINNVRIPLDITEDLYIDCPYVLITPTYGGLSQKRKPQGTQTSRESKRSRESRGVVPSQVIKFLNNNANRALIRGVISAGNTNFGADFARAGDIISHKCSIPYLYRFELMGTQEDVISVQDGLSKFWESLPDNSEVAP